MGKENLKVHGGKKSPKDQRYLKTAYTFKVFKRYLKVHGVQGVPFGPKYPKGT